MLSPPGLPRRRPTAPSIPTRARIPLTAVSSPTSTSFKSADLGGPGTGRHVRAVQNAGTERLHRGDAAMSSSAPPRRAATAGLDAGDREAQAPGTIEEPVPSAGPS